MNDIRTLVLATAVMGSFACGRAAPPGRRGKRAGCTLHGARIPKAWRPDRLFRLADRSKRPAS
jgi:hypothetical protein